MYRAVLFVIAVVYCTGTVLYRQVGLASILEALAINCRDYEYATAVTPGVTALGTRVQYILKGSGFTATSN